MRKEAEMMGGEDSEERGGVRKAAEAIKNPEKK